MGNNYVNFTQANRSSKLFMKDKILNKCKIRVTERNYYKERFNKVKGDIAWTCRIIKMIYQYRKKVMVLEK